MDSRYRGSEVSVLPADLPIECPGLPKLFHVSFLCVHASRDYYDKAHFRAGLLPLCQTMAHHPVGPVPSPCCRESKKLVSAGLAFQSFPSASFPTFLLFLHPGKVPVNPADWISPPLPDSPNDSEHSNEGEEAKHYKQKNLHRFTLLVVTRFCNLWRP